MVGGGAVGEEVRRVTGDVVVEGMTIGLGEEDTEVDTVGVIS